MNILEKILEEIDDHVVEFEAFGTCDDYVSVGWVKEIIRSHMNNTFDVKNTEGSGWISVSEQLPEPLDLVMVTVHTSEWIADYDSARVPDEEKTYHPEEYNTRIAYKIPEGNWIFYDETGSEVCCEEEFGTEKGVCYDVVTAWQPLPEPYKGA